ncbi:surfactin synthase thioesterase subunit [Pedobacter sp. AK017]|uniref:alpha/beta hydrolase n=1 Tax=Pedobacter sp. AK017 TaxID=2723073 RepID=UPI001607DC1F|nr:thioesterase domain-containing protein [Pedobacter sp. AK017]MBB5438568.1 surfactin synthase thioesterase subunit [Pedobacter sp. AK017]
MSKKIYLISGLGADRRAFRKLIFPQDFELVYLDWISPQKNESLDDYATRLALNIDTSTPFYLIGLSFGGMLATEIAKKLKPLHTFLISSSPVYSQLPWYYRLAGSLRLQKLIPIRLLKKGNGIGLKFLGARTDEKRILLKQLVVDSDTTFMKWALTCILTWRNKDLPLNLTHINNGGHFMVYANAAEISNYIVQKISNEHIRSHIKKIQYLNQDKYHNN